MSCSSFTANLFFILIAIATAHKGNGSSDISLNKFSQTSPNRSTLSVVGNWQSVSFARRLLQRQQPQGLAFVPLRTTLNRSFLSQKRQVAQGGTRAQEHLTRNLNPSTRRFYSKSKPTNMPRGVKKENLPSKICVTCGRPFTWRKKWEKVWDEVTTCSKSCNRKRRLAKRAEGKQDNGVDNDERAGNQSDDESTGTYQSSRGEDRSQLEHSGESAAALLPQNASNYFHHDNDFSTISIPTEIDKDTACIYDKQQTPNMDPVALQKVERKAAKKAMKAERRAQREGRGDPSAGQKQCDMCSKSVDLLVRCMYEEGQTEWKMVCGRCWKVASGGVVDGDVNHPHYRYGGLWKNRRAQK